MSQVSRNAIANYAGQAWAALIGIAFVPIYIRYVGIEAYGIIGFFVSLQAFFVILDMGLSASLNRELAVRSARTSRAQETRDLVRTLECIYWPIGAFIAGAVWWVSGPIAEHWLRPVSLSIAQSATAIVLLGLAAALQWPVSIYSAGLAGLQRQVMLNMLVAVFATARAAGAVFVLAVIAPTLEAFLWWQIVVSAAQSITYAGVTWRILPKGEQPAQFRIDELRKIGRFAGGVTGIAIVSFFLTQSDRVILSRILALDAFGVYAFASTLALALLRLVHPIVTAVYPRYSQLAAAEDSAGLAEFYHRSNQVMAAGLLPIAAVLAIFGQDVIFLWTGDQALSAASAPIFVLLLAGSTINGLMNLPYALQLAHGWISLAFWINLVSVLFLVPATWIMGREFGGVGAASIWLVLNIGYLVIGIPLMHRRLLPDQMWRWYLGDIGPPFALCACAALIWKAALPRFPDGLAGWLLLSIVTATIAAGSIAVSPHPRSMVRHWWSTARGTSG